MSCHCNNHVQPHTNYNLVHLPLDHSHTDHSQCGGNCSPCFVQPCIPYCPPTNPCQTKPCGSRHCSECHKHERKSRDKYTKRSNCSSGSSCDEDHRHHKHKKRCNKCYSHNCECIEYYPCLRSRCGFVSAALTTTASPTQYTEAGQVITYHYTITNTGTDYICYPIQICDDKLGGHIIPCSNIPPCMSQTYSRTYTIISTDLEKPFITNTAIAYIKVKHNKWVVTQPTSATITRSVISNHIPNPNHELLF